MKELLLRKGSLYNFNIVIEEVQNRHFHQDIELIYMMEGTMNLEIENESFKLNRDDIVIINSNKKHCFRSKENSIIGCFHFSFEYISSFLKKNLVLFWCNSSIDKDVAYEELRQTVKLILSGYLRIGNEEDLFQYSLVFKLLSILCNSFLVNNREKKLLDKSDKYEERVSEIINYIRGNYNRTISLTDLAEHLYLSTAYLSRFFKKHLGVNFIDYVNKIRVHYAVDDLLYSNKSMTKIALDNGFASSAVFNKIFKETYEMSPSAYQRKMKENIDSNDKDDKILDNQQIKEILNNYFTECLVEENVRDKNVVKNIFVNANNKCCLNNHWNEMINIGKASDILKSDIQEHILVLKNKLKFKYVRFWSIFDDDMYIDIKNKDKNYNFNKIDRVLDFLINNRIKPFIEFSNKGKRIHRNIENEIISNEDKISFTSLQQWENVMERFIIHVINRYGIEEVDSWYCEIMKIEDISEVSNSYGSENYLNVFEVAYKTFKKYTTGLKIGGAGINVDYSKKSLNSILSQWGSHTSKPDFISVYFYPYISDGQHSKRSTDRDFVINKIKELKDIIKQAVPVEEIIISEWNSTLSNRNFINDSCYKGAYMVKNLIDSVNEINMIGYWFGSDLFSEFYDTTSILSGGVGLLSRDGIRKPSFYGIDFMNHLGNNLIEKGENYIIASNNDSYTIVCHNYKHPNYYYYYLKEEDFIRPLEQYKIFDDNNTIKLNFKIQNTKNGEYSVKKYSLSRENGSVLDEWMKMNFTDDISKNEINYLKDICKPRLSIKSTVVDEGVLNIEVILSPHEINRIQIKYKY